MVVRTLRCFAAAFSEVVIVLKPNDATARNLVTQTGLGNVSIALSTAAQEGMGASLRDGARAVVNTPPWIAVGLADMPFVQVATLKSLIARAGQAPASTRVVRPSYRGELGHPVLFNGALLSALCATSGDVGARPVAQAHKRHTLVVDVADPGVVRDIDEPSSLSPPSD